MGAMLNGKRSTAPRQEACPAGIDVPRYVRHIREGHFEEVTYHAGYEDSSSFRKIFQRYTGLRPKEYQRLFQQGNQIRQAG